MQIAPAKPTAEKKTIMTTVNQLVGIAKRYNEIVRRIGNGTLDAEVAKWGLQGIIEDRSPRLRAAVAPSWYIYQLECLMRTNTDSNWGFSEADFPDVPGYFTPQVDGDELLLVPYFPDRGKIKGLERTFDALRSAIVLPNGYTKYRWNDLESGPNHLRQVPGSIWRPGIRWVRYNPNAYQGLSPQAALKQANADGKTLAGIEELAAMLLLPIRVKNWDGKSNPLPNLSGLQCCFDGAWALVPDLRLWGSKVRLLASRADDACPGWASPTAEDLLAA